LLEGLENRKVQLGEEVTREDNTAVRIDNERFQQHLQTSSFPEWSTPSGQLLSPTTVSSCGEEWRPFDSPAQTNARIRSAMTA
jgi:hypothetical protein